MINYKDIVLIKPSEAISNSFVLDISEVVRQKHIIPMQYENINIGGNSDDLHQLSKKLDRYLLHIVEEITEFLEELDKINTIKEEIVLNEFEHKNCLMELIDIAGYISSVISILYIDYYGLDKVKEKKIIQNQIVDMNETYYGCYTVKNVIDDRLLEIEKVLLLEIRRKFPERKWHKDVNRTLSITELDELYKHCINHSSYALSLAVSIFLFLTKNNYWLFTKMFLEKNQIVYSLKEQK